MTASLIERPESPTDFDTWLANRDARDLTPEELDDVNPASQPEPPVKLHGDPTLGGDGLRMAIDADCPHCGWPERYFDTRTRSFGCIKCTYTSDERNA